ncbi:hypothetical protein [Proteus vulgaris]|nr:hypothetical protein [Proteus vulgaris]CRL65603.1 hypothetical protein BN1805_03433 [Proteus vulgaris]
MRSETHITETEAKKIVNNQIPSDKWVLRSIDERDYGQTSLWADNKVLN